MSTMFFLYCVVLIFLISFTSGEEGVFDKIKAGLKNAKGYLETAKNIADLVSKSLRQKDTTKKRGDDTDFSEKQNKPFETINVVSTFFKLLGLDSTKMTAVAVNSFIFVAQVISELFKLTPKVIHAKTVSDETDLSGPMKLITDNGNEKIQNLLQQAYDKSLPSKLIELTKGFDSSCVRLLVCKTSPVIWAAQKSLKNQMINHRDISSWLPSREKFEEYSDICDENHSDCNINFHL
ncbi:uncharacterized protein LOC131668416 [Phymastichus coffea]|uniref:uncharacterized protein LOC131668416 n=1 Tax=Phymastichus coffea TaxID=108790 RepID=UPI00273BB167|nr:uncharacterized protein LOC131668416 [Phymastichus coffea]